MLAYKEKNNLIHQLHPLTAVSFIGVVFLLALLFSHPVYLLALFGGVSLVIIAAGIVPQWKGYLKFTVIMVLFMMVINAIFSNAGTTILLTGPRIPLLGEVEITMEALAYSVGMGIRLLVIISVFCLYSYGVHPDKVLKLLSRRGNKSVLAITLSTRLFPLITQDYQRITEIQRCRGVKFDKGGWWERIKKSIPVMSVLLLSSLERALQLAESMHARGYGSGPRTAIRHDLWRPRDRIIIVALCIGLGIGLWAVFSGTSAYAYYPRMERIQVDSVKNAGVLIVLLSTPALLSWGWGKWPLFRSKI
ncbi:energy-coupling factor transporter transmembrane component T family protein [Dehalobacterium formicoaceticum]|uniref:Energy-coupling factor transporter transmembrane protein EcfT n=1 Tax=Dehalobacterium formicoaceticum TaxID=51515 RepID=A0ABT1Y1V3_9FIRM|nr:energy-coupling factor transporter transmembrane component T [Dehalobacterium formicoaceticum]MCR6544843.1 energy-coupling factor transporter transmembrane protein EcfT [Dehalobacterium formicoaceticum]